MAVTAETPELSLPRLSANGKPSQSPSPSSSAESSFRELDDAFLQTQARIWLGEVLQIRFDEQINISDLLEDGELLFEVSEVISRMLPNPAEDTTHSKLNEWKSVASSKSTRRYMPYYNVDSFLRMCKNLGLDSIDLFTPSDVVEKRNTRKVCMCLRSLSKKVQSRDLSVPDFVNVTCTLALPTDMVEGIRKSLELSQSTSSLSAGHEIEKVSRSRRWQKITNSAFATSSDYSDNCDDAASSSMVSDCNGSSDYSCDAESQNIRGPEVVINDESAINLHIRTGVEDEDDLQCEYLSPSAPESVGSACSEYYSDQELSGIQSSTCLGSCVNGKIPEVNSYEKCRIQNGDINHVPIDWGDSSLDGILSETNHKSYDNEVAPCDASSLAWENNPSNTYFEKLAQPSETEAEERPSDDTKQVPHADGGRDVVVPCKCIEEDGLYAGDAQMSMIGNFEDEQIAAKKDILTCGSSPDVGKSCSHDLCVVYDDCAGEVPVSKSEGLEDELTEVKDGIITGGLSPDCFDTICKEKDVPSELQEYNTSNISSTKETKYCASQISAEAVNVGVNHCDTDSNNANNAPEDVVDRVKKFHVERSPCSVVSDAQTLNSSSSVPVTSNDKDVAQTFADIEHPLNKNENEAFDANMIGSLLLSGPSNNSLGCDAESNSCVMPGHIVVTRDRVQFSVQDSEESHEVSGDHVVLAESIDEHTIVNDVHYESVDHSVPSVNVGGKSVDLEDGDCANNLVTTDLCDTQSGVQVPEPVDDGHGGHRFSENKQKGEPLHLKEEEKSKELPLQKPQRKLLKTVVKGTALVGVAVFLLHLRKSNGLSLPKLKRQLAEVPIKATSKSSAQRGQKVGNTGSVYPAERLHI